MTTLAVPPGGEIVRLDREPTGLPPRVMAVRVGGLRYAVGTHSPLSVFEPHRGRLPGCPAWRGAWDEVSPKVLAWVREHGIADIPADSAGKRRGRR